MIREHDYLFKLILIGSSGVGKTSILTMFADNKFSETYLTTIGVDFRFKMLPIEGKSVKFQIWDTAGQERFRTITSAYYKGADAIIMVYDVTDPTSLDDIEQFWIPEAYNYCDRAIDVLLLGNKSDSSSRITITKLDALLAKHRFHHETVSAKSGERIKESICELGLKLMRKRDARRTDPGSTPTAPSAPQPVPDSSQIHIGAKTEYNMQYKKKCC